MNYLQNFLLLFVASIILTSCASVTRMTREEVNAPVVFMKRGDYELTDDLTASATVSVKSYFIVDVIRWNDKKQIRVFNWMFGSKEYQEGSFNNYYYPKEFDEQVAIYNFNSKYADLDYVTNVRFKRVYKHSPYIKLLNIGKREMTTEIIAKGVTIKNKAEKN
jgi:hypothetical protein